MDIDKLIKDYDNIKNKKIKILESDNYERVRAIKILEEMLVVSDVIFAEYEKQAQELQVLISKKATILDFVKKYEGLKTEFYNDIKEKIDIEDNQDSLNDIYLYMEGEISDYKDDIETLTLDDVETNNDDLDFITQKINLYEKIYNRLKDNPQFGISFDNDGFKFMFK